MNHDDDWPFDSWLKLAVVRFGLSPAQFWAMSVRDWMVLIGRPARQVMSSEAFAALAARFPDNAPDKASDKTPEIKKDTHD